MSSLSPRVASAAEVIFDDPRVDLATITLSEKERYLDMTWGVSIMKSANNEVMAYLRRKENCHIDGHVSGPKITRSLQLSQRLYMELYYIRLQSGRAR